MIDPKLFQIDPTMPYADVDFVVYGKRMCISLPAYKPDNFTLDTLTPTAVKGMCDSYYHDKVTVGDQKYPAFRYAPLRIVSVEHPDPILRRYQGQKDNLTLNGVANKIKLGRSGEIERPNYAIRQRHITYMIAPCFHVTVRITLLPVFNLREDSFDKGIEAYKAIFSRRVAKQQCWKEPHFGLTMFPAKLKAYERENPLTDLNQHIGPMIYDYLYDENDGRVISRRYFDAKIIQGVLDCNWFDGNIKLVLDKEERKNVSAIA